MNDGAARWRRFQLVVNPDEAQPAAALLETASGAASATEMKAGLATVSVYTPAPTATVVGERIRAGLARVQRSRILRSAHFTSALIREQDWATAWKKFFRPFRAAPGLYIAPSWRKRFRAPGRARVLHIDPGMAFGTGQHPSTQLALQLLLANVKRGQIMLDVGCGSGILGIAAAQRGAAVYASDSDRLAVNAAKLNFAANGLSARALRCQRGVPTSFPKARLIAANITARVLAPLAPALRKHLLPAGVLVVSGFAARSRDELQAAMRRAGLRFAAERAAGPWLAHAYRA